MKRALRIVAMIALSVLPLSAPADDWHCWEETIIVDGYEIILIYCAPWAEIDGEVLPPVP